MNINLLHDGELNIVFPERIDSDNTNSIREEIFNLVNDKIKKVNIDMKKLKYISPDGMDIILDLKLKKIEINLSNVYQGTYEVLKTYGFTNFTNVEKKYRYLDAEGLKILGEGKHGKIYEIDDDLAIKVITDDSSFKSIEKEREFSKKAFISGVPSVVTYDIVETYEGYGIVFEKVKGLPLGTYISKNINELENYADKMGELLCKLNNMDLDKKLYDSCKESYLEKIKKLSVIFGEAYTDKCIKIINFIPDDNKAIHMDFHPNNLIRTKDGNLMIIDLANLSIGNKFYDIVSLYLTMYYSAKTSKTGTIENFDLKPNDAIKVFNIVFDKIYNVKNKDEKEILYKMIEIFALIKMSTFIVSDIKINKFKKFLIKIIIKMIFIPHMDEYIKLYEENKELFNR